MKFMADSYIWIGLCAGGSYVYTTGMITDLELQWLTLLLIVTSTTALYSFLQAIKKPTPTLKWIVSLSSILAFTALVFSKPDLSYFILLPSMAISIGYGRLPWLKKNLRSIPYLKVFIISIVWVWVTLLFPVYISQIKLTWEISIFVVSQLLFLLAVTIPFDIRDLKYDSLFLKTIPQIIGAKNARSLCLLLLALSSLLAILYLYFLGMNKGIIAVICTWLFSWITLFRVKENAKPTFYTINVDGLLLIQGIMVLIIR